VEEGEEFKQNRTEVSKMHQGSCEMKRFSKDKNLFLYETKLQLDFDSIPLKINNTNIGYYEDLSFLIKKKENLLKINKIDAKLPILKSEQYFEQIANTSKENEIKNELINKFVNIYSCGCSDEVNNKFKSIEIKKVTKYPTKESSFINFISETKQQKNDLDLLPFDIENNKVFFLNFC
jgi:hypothetical protein